MTLLLVFVAALFTIAALWLTVSPFLGGADEGLRLEHLDEEVREIELLVAQRRVLLAALRELDVDRETDKLSADDYALFRRRYENQAVVIMKRLDEIHGGHDWRELVGAELGKRLGHPSRLGVTESSDAESADAPAPAPETTVEAVAEAVVEAPEDDAAPSTDNAPSLDARCAACDEVLEADDRFCSQCGAPVGVHEAAPSRENTEANA